MKDNNNEEFHYQCLKGIAGPQWNCLQDEHWTAFLKNFLCLHLLLASTLIQHDWDMVVNSAMAQACLPLSTATSRQKQKFSHIHNTQHPMDHVDTDKVTINFTNRVLDPPAVAILSKGLNFAHTSLRSNPASLNRSSRSDTTGDSRILRQSKPQKKPLKQNEKHY
jgi:hypothetical protein